jgi:hypothetical protein
MALPKCQIALPGAHDADECGAKPTPNHPMGARVKEAHARPGWIASLHRETADIQRQTRTTQGVKALRRVQYVRGSHADTVAIGDLQTQSSALDARETKLEQQVAEEDARKAWRPVPDVATPRAAFHLPARRDDERLPHAANVVAERAKAQEARCAGLCSTTTRRGKELKPLSHFGRQPSESFRPTFAGSRCARALSVQTGVLLSLAERFARPITER